MSAAPIHVPTPPFQLGGTTHRDLWRAWITAAAFVGACGIVIFGVCALEVLAVSIACAIGAEWLASLVMRKPVVGGYSHSLLIGLLLGLTLPATVSLYLPAIGALVAIVFGKVIFGGTGHYLWHPALVGRVVVEMIITLSAAGGADPAGAQRPDAEPVLAPGHLLTGNLDKAVPVAVANYGGFTGASGPDESPAWRLERPVFTLRRFTTGRLATDGKLVYEPLIRDNLPPWQDTLLGTVPGGIGETCGVGLIVAGLFLIYHNALRWQFPVAMLVAAALAAAILPVEAVNSVEALDGATRAGISAGGTSFHWFPIFAAENGRAVGLAYVLHNLTAGQLMLGAFLLGPDMIATPLRVRGQVFFAACVGVLTVFMRLYGVVDGECYWSILIMNTVVPVIDRATQREVLGLAVAPA